MTITEVITALPSSRKKCEVFEDRLLASFILLPRTELWFPESGVDGQSGMIISCGLVPRLCRRRVLSMLLLAA